MKRRDFLKASSATGVLLAAERLVQAGPETRPAGKSLSLQAGFARETITPPRGTRMMGFGARDFKRGCQSVHDDVHVRALFLRHGDERVLILAYDLCFLGREDADRLKGALGREFDLAPRQILLNTSHNHAGPMVGTWYWAGFLPVDRLYLNQLERATLRAARQARESMREATMAAHFGQTTLPLNRRKPDGKGDIEFAPNPQGKVYDRLPVCLIEDKAGKPICLLFSVSAHPSMIGGFDITAEYPGVACRLLDEHLGATAAMFLQGVGGDAKPSVIGKGLDKWRKATWEDMEQAGRIVADEARRVLDKGLVPVEPDIRSAVVETRWPLQKLPPRSEFEAVVNQTKPEARENDIRCRWAARQLELLDRGDGLPTDVGIIVQAIRLGKDLRLVGIEGEPVGVWGYLIEDLFSLGVTFPLGYCNGQGLYLPASRMLPEGGYEVVSYWEYGLAAPLAPGMEDIVLAALARMREQVVG
ncbi:MAG TPA: twin-arginine translocation signal domain-containing protein [Phycisphaerae bacterium]|nr:twin-arginine translocation signal domain-containing protein [Phycisphaerae bacterium]